MSLLSVLLELCNTQRYGLEKSQQNSYASVPVNGDFRALQHLEVWSRKKPTKFSRFCAFKLKGVRTLQHVEVFSRLCTFKWRLAKHRGLTSVPRGGGETRAEKPPILLPGVRLQSPSSPGQVFYHSVPIESSLDIFPICLGKQIFFRVLRVRQYSFLIPSLFVNVNAIRFSAFSM